MTALEMIVAQAQHEAQASYQDGGYNVYVEDGGWKLNK